MNQKEVVRLAKLEQKVDNIGDEFKSHKQEQREDFDKVFKLIGDLPKQMDKTYARKEDLKTLRDEVNQDQNQKFQWKQTIPGLIIGAIAILISIMG